ncbi:antibiotic biosynthesis monooxygenase family protein [Roseibium sp. SCP14]|uniref:antibiotic biosynthesis monooxygenase family protein n=1 Tax=Roseibium sp. SCP14 TaxID=3141375 RepID=UPI003334D290
MIAVIFEVIPHADKKQDYLGVAAELRPLIDEIDGFLSVERFQSLTNPEKLLSVSFFRDEEALNEWRRLTQHRKAQKAGRSGYFKDYRLRVAHVLRDYGMEDRDEAPEDSRAVNG